VRSEEERKIEMGKLIIDKVTGTVLNIEGCYVIDADQLDGSFTDSEIADLADRVGVPVARAEVGTMEEHEGIELYHQMSSKFGWVGCIFTVADIRMRLAEDGLEGDELEKMVEKTQQTRSWRKVMEDAMNREGYEVLAEAIQEGTRLYLAIEREEQ
jgi:hypothetical protein